MTKAEKERFDKLEARVKELEDITWKIVTGPVINTGLSYPASPYSDPSHFPAQAAFNSEANAAFVTPLSMSNHPTTVHGDTCCGACGQALPQGATLPVLPATVQP